jgi:hypothetical protein
MKLICLVLKTRPVLSVISIASCDLCLSFLFYTVFLHTISIVYSYNISIPDILFQGEVFLLLTSRGTEISQSIRRLSTGWTAKRSEFESWHRPELCFHQWGPPSTRGAFPGDKAARVWSCSLTSPTSAEAKKTWVRVW